MVKRVKSADASPWVSPAYHRPFPKREPDRELTPQEKANIERTISAIRALLAKPKPDPKAWAQKILDRVAAGEHFSPFVVSFATEVAGHASPPLPTREAGED